MQKQITITKPATQASKPARSRTASKMAQAKADKPAQQEAPQQATQQAQEAPKGIAYGIADYARPQHGAALFAHTAAFLQLSGITDGKAYPKAKATQVIGATAVKYHSANGNLSQTADGLTLTDKGRAFFAARGEADKELLAAFTKVLTTGELDDRANVKAESSRFALK